MLRAASSARRATPIDVKEPASSSSTAAVACAVASRNSSTLERRAISPSISAYSLADGFNFLKALAYYLSSDNSLSFWAILFFKDEIRSLSS